MRSAKKRASSAKGNASARVRSSAATMSGSSSSRPPRKPAGDETRVASRGARIVFEQILGRLPNPDSVVRKYGRGRISLYSQVLQDYGFIGGHCSQWINQVLRADRTIKAATADTADQQLLADDAAVRATKAWARVRNRVIVLQKLLMGRFYGFSRAEKVWRFDEVCKEWIQDLYDVPWEAWMFDNNGNDFLVTTFSPLGIPVDASRFLHFQWGSADTKYGQGDLADVYALLWKIQQIEEFGLKAVEDWSKLVAIVHIPRGFGKKDRADAIASVKEQYRYYVTVPTDEAIVKIDTPNINVTSNGAAGRQEFEVIRFYERWIQIRLLGAPQTQDKATGTGKLEDTRKSIWEDPTALGSSALDQCLTEGWLDPYCSMNMADLPVELRPRFESDSIEITAGLSGPAAQTATDLVVKLAAKQITAIAAQELLAALGLPRQRARAIVDSTMKERDTLVNVATLPRGDVPDPSQPPAEHGGGAQDDDQQQEAA